MGLIWIRDVSVSFGGPRLLDGASLQIEAGQRIGLVGRNGSGKSTLLKLLTGEVPPDSGEIIRGAGVRIALLPQDVPDDLPGTVYDVVASGGREHLALLRQYRELTRQMSGSGGGDLLARLARVQQELETSGAWHYHRQVEQVISRTSLAGDAEFRFLSAGLKRRVFLARALVNEPDLLLLDEPTNHLDLASILWLESFLLNFDRTLMFVTHDRAFLQTLSTAIVEIDRGRLTSFFCPYGAYLERRKALLEAEEKQWEACDRKLAREEIWIRQGIKARRTRNEGRVRELVRMRRERASRLEQTGRVRLTIPEGERSGRLVAEAQKISFAFGDRPLVAGFSTTILRGDKVGIIGPNGSGKTTLLKIVLGELAPQQGSVRLGAGIQVAYFDQLRSQLDGERSLKDNVAEGNDLIVTGGVSRHIVAYLQDFLFPPDRILSPVGSLSGGERNRLLLAKLFVLPSNVLVLDEPTNDLDTETLELLEERLLGYRGTVLLVSHDRAFLNNVVTSTIVFEGAGRLMEYVGGYDDWLRQKASGGEPPRGAVTEAGRSALQAPTARKARPVREKRKLSYKETLELEALPARIEALEQEKGELVATLGSPAFYAGGNTAEIGRAADRLKALDGELEAAYGRWEELENLADKFNARPSPQEGVEKQPPG
jgi:ATP-binding cassette subfamily F protein uup